MIETARLTLRPPEPSDLHALAAMWGDPCVMADLGPVKDMAASVATFDRHLDYWREGYGFWVVERDGALAGFAGLKPGAPDTPIVGEVEAGWMFRPEHWGQGLAAEAMYAALDWGWARLPVPRIVAITAARNAASRRLMVRLGMHHVAAMDFMHPLLPPDTLGPTVTYAIDRPA